MPRVSRFLLVLTFAGLFAASSARAEDKEVALFNGKNLEGWTFFLNDPKAKLEDVWSVEDGVLICKGKPAGYIRTEKDYTNYVLTLEWRFNKEKGAGNSGVLLRTTGKDKIWPKSVEAQLHSGNAGDIWNIDECKITVDKQRTEGRRTVKKSGKDANNEMPLGDWNQYEITVNKGNLMLKVNGRLQNEATDYEEVPGKICLQSEGAEIHFRNIKLKVLD